MSSYLVTSFIHKCKRYFLPLPKTGALAANVILAYCLFSLATKDLRKRNKELQNAYSYKYIGLFFIKY